ncbi:hypothetical protein OR1_04149 [Geobacter sp. OR-1]|uniref:hypothetical protein n=1 Tax=Geobacter sp. OR-1 TaxID=1266765 RepID=UPI000542EAE1|nr:hypothetical protein [Geobacter sp. OR-1]GAM11831.1 hypothetical protein OR1_04149 [Geobacter sp. OR-1]
MLKPSERKHLESILQKNADEGTRLARAIAEHTADSGARRSQFQVLDVSFEEDVHDCWRVTVERIS